MNSKTLHKTRHISLFLMYALFGWATISCVGEKKEESTTDFLNTVVQEVNKQLPRKLDNITWLDSVSLKKPNTLNYHYRLIQNDSILYDWDVTRKNAIEKAQNNIDSLNSVSKLFSGRDVKMHHFYVDSIGKPLFDFIIKPSNQK